jgi:hypothetical protein
MARSIEDPKEIFPEVTADYKRIFGDDLVSIILYGSATGPDYRAGKSDINFMILLSEKGMDRLEEAFEAVKKWQKRNVAIPLFLTESYVETSTDVFPIEYLNFQRKHVLVFGRDILEDLTFDPEFLRRQCEREIKGKLLLLRQAYLEASGRGKALRKVIRQSLGAFVAIFEVLLYLKGQDSPAEKRAIVRATAEAFDMDAGLFEKIFDIKEDKTKLDDTALRKLYRGYLREVGNLARLVDTLED